MRVIEDILLALYLAILQPVLGNASGPAEVATDLAKAFTFLIVLAARIAPFVAGYVLVLAVIGPLAVIRSERLAAPRKRSASKDKMSAMIATPAPEGSSTEPGDTRRTTSSESQRC